jgi:hypothetical protein
MSQHQRQEQQQNPTTSAAKEHRISRNYQALVSNNSVGWSCLAGEASESGLAVVGVGARRTGRDPPPARRFIDMAYLVAGQQAQHHSVSTGIT